MFKKRCINEVKKFNNLRVNKSLSANKLIGVKKLMIFWANLSLSKSAKISST